MCRSGIFQPAHAPKYYGPYICGCSRSSSTISSKHSSSRSCTKRAKCRSTVEGQTQLQCIQIYVHNTTSRRNALHTNANVFFHVQELRQCKVISKKQVIPTLLSSWFIPRYIHVCVYMMSHTHICHQTKMKYIHIHTGMRGTKVKVEHMEWRPDSTCIVIIVYKT